MQNTRNTTCYINSCRQISVQKPLTDDWLSEPQPLAAGLNRAQDPSFSAYMDPMQARRCPLPVKRAIAVSVEALKAAGVEMPDAVISATSLGCNENNQKFLLQMIADKEQFLKPTFFINSTHNTIGSAVAIHLKAKGYNSSYSNGFVSFESALQDTLLQIEAGEAENVLLGAHEEMNEAYYKELHKTGLTGSDAAAYGEGSAAFVLGSKRTADSLCGIVGTRLFNATQGDFADAVEDLCAKAHIGIDEIDFIMTGIGSSSESDARYKHLLEALPFDYPLVSYKPIFGMGYCASAFGLYAAALKLNKKGNALIVNAEATISAVTLLIL